MLSGQTKYFAIFQASGVVSYHIYVLEVQKLCYIECSDVLLSVFVRLCFSWRMMVGTVCQCAHTH